MSSLVIPQPREQVTYLLVVSLPTEGLINGFRAEEWTTVERFQDVEVAKVRLHRLRKPLTALAARAFIVQETDPRKPNRQISWRTIVRYNEPEVYLSHSDAVEASKESLESWVAAATALSAPSSVRAQRAPSTRGPIVVAALMAAAMVALIGMFATLRVPTTQPKVAPPSAFIRAGGIMMSIPDKHRAGWYVRVKVYPDKSVEIVDRFPAYAKGLHWKDGDRMPEDLVADIDRP